MVYRVKVKSYEASCEHRKLYQIGYCSCKERMDIESYDRYDKEHLVNSKYAIFFPVTGWIFNFI